MQKLKIVHVYKSFNVYNGLIEILTIMAQNFDYERYEFGVCVNEYEHNPFGEKFQKAGGQIFNLNLKSGLNNKHNEFLALHSFLKQYKPHIIQTHVLKANLYGTIAARMVGVPVIITTEMTLKDTAPTAMHRMRDRIIQPFVSYMIKKSDRFIVTSEYIKNQWMNRGNEKIIEVVYPPFNLEKYDKAVRTPRKKIESIGKMAGFVGRLSEEKSINTLLEAMAIVIKEIPDMGCTIVGTGPMEQRLKSRCDILKISDHIEFTGYMENSFEALREIDVFVLPSRTEGCPIVILEAMAMGLPVVATNIGGNPELVTDNETGLLVPCGDSNRMANAIIELVKNRERARTMGQNGRRRAFSQFNPSSFASKMQMLYQALYDKKCVADK